MSIYYHMYIYIYICTIYTIMIYEDIKELQVK